MSESRTNKRANHNAMERKRRDHIKDSFDSLRRRVDISNDKASRSSILQKAKERIVELEAKIRAQEEDEEKILWANEEIRRKLEALGDVEFVEKQATRPPPLPPKATSPLKKFARRHSPLREKVSPLKRAGTTPTRQKRKPGRPASTPGRKKKQQEEEEEAEEDPEDSNEEEGEDDDDDDEEDDGEDDDDGKDFDSGDE